jgi:hypothetical protein
MVSSERENIMRPLSLGLLAVALGIGSSSVFGVITTNVTFANDAGFGLGDMAQNPLAVGDLVEIGSFNIPDAQIATLAAVNNGEATLLSHFTQYGSPGCIGDGSIDNNNNPLAGFFYDTTINASTNALGIQHLPIYLIAFNSDSVGSATQQLIVTGLAPNVANGWLFPADDDIPNTAVLELDGSTKVVVGGMGGTDSSLAQQAGYGLGTMLLTYNPPLSPPPYPEPATWSSMAGGLALLAAYWTRRRSLF